MTVIPDELGIIAGKGVYPRLLAESARKQGVKRIFAIAFKRETNPVINDVADDVCWLHLGKLEPLLDAFKQRGTTHAVMAGQITPTHLFNVRMDRKMMTLLSRLKVRNADTIFGAVGDELKSIGVDLLPAYLFMEACMPDAGQLAGREPNEQQWHDIEMGLHVAKTTSGLDIGQTVVMKQGTILAVEAFEGTDEAILRAGRLGGKGAVVIKVASQHHDMRFDIPVVGMRTMKTMKKAHVAVLALEAGRTILLEREMIVQEAERMRLCMVAVNFERKCKDDSKKN